MSKFTFTSQRDGTLTKISATVTDPSIWEAVQNAFRATSRFTGNEFTASGGVASVRCNGREASSVIERLEALSKKSGMEPVSNARPQSNYRRLFDAAVEAPRDIIVEGRALKFTGYGRAFPITNEDLYSANGIHPSAEYARYAYYA